MIKFMIGIRVAMALLTNKLTFVKSLLALSKRFSLNFSLPKALMTKTPDKFSRIVKFNLSIKVCIILNFGNTTTIAITKTTTITTKIIPMIQVILGEFVIALYNAPTPIIGANNTILSIMTINA